MVGDLCTLDDVREQVDSVHLEEEIETYERYVTTRLERVLREQGVQGRVVNNGSTGKTRKTYILDPRGKYKLFPPDVDLNVIVDVSEIPKGLERSLMAPFSRGGHTHTDEKYHKVIGVLNCGDFNVSMALYTEEVYQANAEFVYNEMITPFDDRGRREVKTLRLILQRHGCYGGWNRGVPGVAADEMVRVYGSVEASLAFLLEAASEKEHRQLQLPGTDRNILNSVSNQVWQRVHKFTERYAREGTVNADPYSIEHWTEDHHPDDIFVGTIIRCAPGSCGREGDVIARAVREYLQQFLACFGVKHSADYHIMPSQGIRGSGAVEHTHIFAAFNPGDKVKLRTKPCLGLFHNYMKMYSMDRHFEE